MVGVEMGEQEPPQVSRVMAECADGCGDLRGGAGDAGVDEGQAIRVLAQVGMPDREAQEVQARDQLDDVHTVTLGGPGRGVPWYLLPADRPTAGSPAGGPSRDLPAAGPPATLRHLHQM